MTQYYLNYRLVTISAHITLTSLFTTRFDTERHDTLKFLYALPVAPLGLLRMREVTPAIKGSAGSRKSVGSTNYTKDTPVSKECGVNSSQKRCAGHGLRLTPCDSESVRLRCEGEGEVKTIIIYWSRML